MTHIFGALAPGAGFQKDRAAVMKTLALRIVGSAQPAASPPALGTLVEYRRRRPRIVLPLVGMAGAGVVALAPILLEITSNVSAH